MDLRTLEKGGVMLDQTTIDRLLALEKALVASEVIAFPAAGEAVELKAASADGREAFLIDVNRRGKIKVSKCTYQERYKVIEILLRLDVDGPPHENPDGTEVPCPHLHIYREGYATKWAYSIEGKPFTNTADLVQTLRDFLVYCGVKNIPPIQKPIL